MTAWPPATPVAMPFWSIVATRELLDDQANSAVAIGLPAASYAVATKGAVRPT
jgi:hypothetical protein